MADELLRRRKQSDIAIAEQLKLKGMTASARDVSKTRLGIAGNNVGSRPQWINPTCALQTNEFSAESQQELTRKIRHEKAILRGEINTSGEQLVGKGKYGVFLTGEDTSEVEKVDTSTMTSEQQARMAHEKRRACQKQILEDNKVTNRYLANHIYNTTEQNTFSTETHREMQDCTTDGRIESQQDVLKKGHDKMYKSAEYQTVLKRRKDIKLCKDAEGSLSESAQRTVGDLLEFDKLTDTRTSVD